MTNSKTAASFKIDENGIESNMHFSCKSVKPAKKVCPFGHVEKNRSCK